MCMDKWSPTVIVSLTLSQAGIGAGDAYPLRLMKLEPVMFANCCQCLFKHALSTGLRVKTMQLEHVEPTRTAPSLAHRFGGFLFNRATPQNSSHAMHFRLGFSLTKTIQTMRGPPWPWKLPTQRFFFAAFSAGFPHKPGCHQGLAQEKPRPCSECDSNMLESSMISMMSMMSYNVYDELQCCFSSEF